MLRILTSRLTRHTDSHLNQVSPMGNVILVFVFVFVTKLSTLLCLPIVPVNFVSRILVVRFILVSVFQTSIYECPVQLQF